MSKFMASIDTRLASVESRSASMEEQGRDRANHVGSSKIGGNLMDSEETYSDQNLDPNRQFQRQDSRFRYQDPQFKSRQPLIKLEFPRFVEGDDPLAWVYKA